MDVNTSSQTSASQLQTSVQFSLQKKSMDIAKNDLALLENLPGSKESGKGGQVDMMA